MIRSVELLPGVTLRVFPDDRFKQNCLSIQFVRPMTQEEAAYNALLPAVLLRGCQSAPDMRDIILRLDDLYGASIGALVRRVGDYQTTGMSCSFISDRFALDGDKILAPMVAFLGDILLAPVLEQGAFRPDYVEGEKKNLIATIQAQKNDKRTYCTTQMLRKMCRCDSYGIPRLGDAEAVAAITPESLYAHYQKVLAESTVELCYVGQDMGSALETAIYDLFRNVKRSYVNLPPQTHFCSAGGGEYTENMDIAQCKLSVGFSTDIDLRTGDFAAMQVCNTLFGGGMTSKLFMNVREKMSLCYDIGSSYYGSKGILNVSAGIDPDKLEIVRQQIKAQLEAICNGDITDGELAAAKQALISGLKGTHDSPGSIEGYYSSAALSGLSLDPAAYIAAIEQVDKASVAAVARTLTPDTVYILRGEQ